MATFKNIERTALLKAIKSRDVREEMEGIMDTAGQDSVWRYTPDAGTGKEIGWDGKSSFGVTALPGASADHYIVLKTSKAGITKIIQRYKNSYISAVKGGSKWYKDGEFIYIFLGIQRIKFVQTSKLTDSKGKAISEATMTKMQELGSAHVFKRAIEDNKEWGSVEKLKADDDTMSGLRDIWKKVGKSDLVDDEWIDNFYKQQKKLIDCIGKPDFTTFNRDNGFMTFISDIVRDNFQISSKDNWNPADIWLIQNETKWKDYIKKAVNSGTRGHSPAKTLAEFNAIMRMLFKSKQVFGISLKKVAAGEDARMEFLNHKSEFFTKLSQMHFTYEKAECKLGTKNDKEGTVTLQTQDTRLLIKDGSNTYNFQIKANDSTKMSGLKYEPTSSGATAARLGKATVDLVMRLVQDYKQKGFIEFQKNYTAYPQNADQFRNNKNGNWKDMLSCLQANGVNFGDADAEQAWKNLEFVFGTKPHVANAKCQQIKWLCGFMKLDAGERDDFGTDMVFLAKKEGKSYGPFAKIY